MNKYLCPVCGFLMDDPAKDYNICPCCSTEFELNDAFATHTELREVWIRGGMKFWHEPERPGDYNPYAQLARFQPQTSSNTLAAPERGKDGKS